jgi:hypothetical protein
MSAIRTTLAAAAMLVLSAQAAAQMFKCANAAGKISYSDTECSALGLKDAGEVKDRLNSSPAYQPPPPSKPAPAAPAQSAPEPAAAVEPPERRCFTTNVKGRSVTRCNDQPDEPPQ